MRVLKHLLLLVSLVAPFFLEGQIRILPRQLLDSVQNPVAEPCRLQFPTEPLQMGTISEQGGEWCGVVRWQNNEPRAVVITAVKSSCGCLRADYSAEPLKRGEVGELVVHYNPKGHPGAVEQRLFVYTNLSASRPSAVVRLTGRVVADTDRSADYPYACGALLLRTLEVRYEEGATLRVACLNGGKTPLKIRRDRMLCPAGVELATEPEVLAPGEAGDLVVRFTEQFRPRGDTMQMLCFEGVGALPPRKRSLKLVFE